MTPQSARGFKIWRPERRARAALSLIKPDPSKIDPLTDPPDPSLIFQWGARECIRDGLLPWRKSGGHVIILAANQKNFERHRSALHAHFGRIKYAEVERERLQHAVQRIADPILAPDAENRCPEEDSCRDWCPKRSRKIATVSALIASVLTLLWPAEFLIALCFLACACSFAVTGLRLCALIAFIAQRNAPEAPLLHSGEDLPIISILVPLFREEHIAEHLRARLTKLNYPRDKLDVIIAIEASDELTLRKLAATPLPSWMRAITVPKGRCQTKPRALNYVLDFARGSIIGVYDAEDAPEPDQLLKVARRFAVAPKDVACLQGQLDYYNSRHNWMARCFTIEYASWFRVMLPGLARLGFLIPLGGTTLFFKRNILEALGSWDAHNVTEDADLGIRLARRGYRTEIIETVTYEEANALALPWIKQRSRWIKGYAITYWVHMRAPRRLLRELGPKKFFGLQIQFGATLLSTLTAPLLWTFWLGLMGAPHAFLDALPTYWMITMILLFMIAELVNVTAAAFGTSIARHDGLIKWAPTLYAYYPLATLAALKGHAELLTTPFYWDKTIHGHFGGAQGKAQAKAAD